MTILFYIYNIRINAIFSPQVLRIHFLENDCTRYYDVTAPIQGEPIFQKHGIKRRNAMTHPGYVLGHLQSTETLLLNKLFLHFRNINCGSPFDQNIQSFSGELFHTRAH